MTDRERWILGVAGSIATLGIGYLIWRHEHAISQADAANNAAQQDAALQQLENQIASGPAYGNGSSPSYFPQGGTIDPVGASTPSDLAAILAAFFPQGTTPSPQGGSNPTPPPSTGDPTAPPTNPGAPVNPRGTPVRPTGPAPSLAPAHIIVQSGDPNFGIGYSGSVSPVPFQPGTPITEPGGGFNNSGYGAYGPLIPRRSDQHTQPAV